MACVESFAPLSPAFMMEEEKTSQLSSALSAPSSQSTAVRPRLDARSRSAKAESAKTQELISLGANALDEPRSKDVDLSTYILEERLGRESLDLVQERLNDKADDEEMWRRRLVLIGCNVRQPEAPLAAAGRTERRMATAPTGALPLAGAADEEEMWRMRLGLLAGPQSIDSRSRRSCANSSVLTLGTTVVDEDGRSSVACTALSAAPLPTLHEPTGLECVCEVQVQTSWLMALLTFITALISALVPAPLAGRGVRQSSSKEASVASFCAFPLFVAIISLFIWAPMQAEASG